MTWSVRKATGHSAAIYHSVCRHKCAKTGGSGSALITTTRSVRGEASQGSPFSQQGNRRYGGKNYDEGGRVQGITQGWAAT